MILLGVLLPHHHHHHNHLLKLLLAHLIVLIGQHWSIVHHRGEEVDLGVSHLYISGFIASDIATFCHIAISVEKKATRCVS